MSPAILYTGALRCTEIYNTFLIRFNSCYSTPVDKHVRLCIITITVAKKHIFNTLNSLILFFIYFLLNAIKI